MGIDIFVSVDSLESKHHLGIMSGPNHFRTFRIKHNYFFFISLNSERFLSLAIYTKLCLGAAINDGIKHKQSAEKLAKWVTSESF